MTALNRKLRQVAFIDGTTLDDPIQTRGPRFQK